MISEFDPIISCARDLLISFPAASKVKAYIDARLSKEAQEKFEFGYFPSNEHLHIMEETVGESCLAKTKLIYDRMQDNRKIRQGVLSDHNLIMPYKDVYGKTVGIVGRTISSDEERENSGVAKYKNTSFDKGKNLFGLHMSKRAILAKGVVIVLEGQIDLIRAMESGIDNVVALGSSNMTMEQVALLSRYCDKIVLLLDNDEAGRTGAERIKAHLEKYIGIRVARLPAGFKDIGEMNGEELRELVI
jgi:DNA primase